MSAAPKPATIKRRPARHAAPTIGLEELCARLANPNVSEKSLQPYLIAEVPRNGISPVLLPNPETVSTKDQPLLARADLGLGFLNGVFRKRRENLFRQRLAEGDKRPILLTEGDSWFQYPIWLDDVVDCLQANFTICCLSAAGDTLDNLATKKPEYLKWLDRLISKEGRTLHAVLFSAGGNDLVGGQLANMLKPFTADKPASWYIDNGNYLAREARLVVGYRSIFKAVHDRWPNLKILIHGYDHAIPLPPQGLHLPPLDGWLGDPLRKRGINDKALQAGIVREMIDRFNTMLARIAAETPNVVYVDLRGVIGSDWHDELHPNDAGFRRLTGKFKEHL